MNEQGIEQLSAAVVSVIDLAETIEKSAADKKINLIEGIMIGNKSLKAVRVLVDFDTIKAEVKDLSSEELTELCELVEQELDLENDKVEGLINQAIGMLKNFAGIREAFSGN